MKTFLISLCSPFLLATAVCGQTGGMMPAAARESLAKQYCVGCHNDKLKSGGFSLTSIDVAHPAQNPDQVERVIRKLRVGLMPPAGAPRPDAATMKAFISTLEQGIDQAASANPNPG